MIDRKEVREVVITGPAQSGLEFRYQLAPGEVRGEAVRWFELIGRAYVLSSVRGDAGQIVVSFQPAEVVMRVGYVRPVPAWRLLLLRLAASLGRLFGRK
jgi:hypothetical protein